LNKVKTNFGEESFDHHSSLQLEVAMHEDHHTPPKTPPKKKKKKSKLSCDLDSRFLIILDQGWEILFGSRATLAIGMALSPRFLLIGDVI
jgi:hypothetical protein